MKKNHRPIISIINYQAAAKHTFKTVTQISRMKWKFVTAARFSDEIQPTTSSPHPILSTYTHTLSVVRTGTAAQNDCGVNEMKRIKSRRCRRYWFNILAPTAVAAGDYAIITSVSQSSNKLLIKCAKMLIVKSWRRLWWRGSAVLTIPPPSFAFLRAANLPSLLCRLSYTI